MGSLRSARLLTAVCLLAAGCVDTKDVFVRRDQYTEPLTAAEGFLGYNDVAGKSPVCGACHAEKYDEWKDTKHAGAWSALTESGQAQQSCEGQQPASPACCRRASCGSG